MGPWPLPVSIGVFAGGALLTAVFGVRLARAGDALADRTRLGEAIFGSILFGGMISLSGIVMTATAAVEGEPSLAYGNAVGGVAAQIMALGVADLVYRSANLEHASASMPNAMSAVVLIWLLCVALLGSHTPPLEVGSVSVFSVLMVALYLFGLWQVRKTRTDPQWQPTATRDTVEDVPERRSERSTTALWTDFLLSGVLVCTSGWAVARAASSIVAQTGLDASFVGAVLMGGVNAIPETVTAIAAVRTGAVTLAVGGVIGGNTFDVLNVAVGDVFYRGGSLYHAVERDDIAVTVGGLLMTAIVLAGMLRRQRRGPLGVGFEGISLAVVYAALVAITVL
jgi:cation:H+ antiporter